MRLVGNKRNSMLSACPSGLPTLLLKPQHHVCAPTKTNVAMLHQPNLVKRCAADSQTASEVRLISMLSTTLGRALDMR